MRRSRPTWWLSFSDSTLNTLEGQALEQNQTLAAAVAHYEQAKATLANIAAQQVPEVDVGGTGERFKISKNRPLTSYGTPNSSTVQNGLIRRPVDQLRHGPVRPDSPRSGRGESLCRAVGRRSRQRPARADHGPCDRLLLAARARCRDRRVEPVGGAAAESARLRDLGTRSGLGVRTRRVAAEVGTGCDQGAGATAARATRRSSSMQSPRWSPYPRRNSRSSRRWSRRKCRRFR